MTQKRSVLEAASIKWVQDEYRKLTEKRADGMATFITHELQHVLGQQQKPQAYDVTSIENIIDRAWGRGALPVPKEAVAFEIWNGLHMLGIDITHIDRSRYIPRMEGGAAPSRLREAFRKW
jgi:hypothetical protein